MLLLLIKVKNFYIIFVLFSPITTPAHAPTPTSTRAPTSTPAPVPTPTPTPTPAHAPRKFTNFIHKHYEHLLSKHVLPG